MGKNQSKAKEKAKEALTPAEINALVISTKLTPEEIIKWHTGFMLDCPTGRLSKKEFIKIYEELFPTGKATKFCDLVFNVFAKNESESIDFSEFIMACSITSRGKPKDTLALAFEIYDSTATGTVKRDEMQVLIEAVHELYEGVPISKQISKQKVDFMMNKFDQDHVGAIKKEDFLETFSSDPKIRALLNSKQNSNRTFSLDKHNQ